jgi:hypothetical protein
VSNAQTIVQEVNELFTVLNLVQAGVGVSLVPRSVRLMRVPDVRLLDTNLAEARWRICIAWHKVNQSDPLVRNFVSLARRPRNATPVGITGTLTASAYKNASVSSYSLWNRCRFLCHLDLDFLPRCTGRDRVCTFPARSSPTPPISTVVRGSAVERSAVFLQLSRRLYGPRESTCRVVRLLTLQLRSSDWP